MLRNLEGAPSNSQNTEPSKSGHTNTNLPATLVIGTNFSKGFARRKPLEQH
jgi:hypothetical protein